MLATIYGDADPVNGDQADLEISASLNDIRTAAGLDYDPVPDGPDATVVERFRLSDTDNGVAGLDPATTADFDLPVGVSCVATLDPTQGSDCSVSSTADAVNPGLIRELKSMVLQTFRVRVNDSGTNGTRGDSDDRIFAVQGIYVP